MSGHSVQLKQSNLTVSKDQIRAALEVIHDVRSPNQIRQEASEYLEKVKLDDEAPHHGYSIAADQSQPSVIRHFGLSLLEHAIRHRWNEYTLEQSTILREWELGLARNITDQDPSYLRNKIASIWVDVAKRSWALDWMDMDECLTRLWDGPLASKELVLAVLETLSEDVFGHEDLIAGLRSSDLSRACFEIFTPISVLQDHYSSRGTNINVRYGDEGWLSRMGDLLEWCIGQEGTHATGQACAVKILVTLRSVIGWAAPQSLSATRMTLRLCQALRSSHLPIQLVSTRSPGRLFDSVNRAAEWLTIQIRNNVSSKSLYDKANFSIRLP